MKIFPQSLHIQFHGREMHSLCFVYENVPTEAIGKCGLFDKCSWVATGCEDGTVRLTRYAIVSTCLLYLTLLVSFLIDNL